jgi:hypothetical protein
VNFDFEGQQREGQLQLKKITFSFFLGLVKLGCVWQGWVVFA